MEPVEVELPAAAFAGQLERPQLHLDAVGRLEQELRDLRAAVADYAQGIDEVDTGNAELLGTADALRQAMGSRLLSEALDQVLALPSVGRRPHLPGSRTTAERTNGQARACGA